MPVKFAQRTGSGVSGLEVRSAYAQAQELSSRPLTVEAGDDRATPASVPPERLQLMKAEIRHLSAIMTQLVTLWHGEDHDEYGRLRPTRHSYECCSRLLVDAAIVAAADGRQIPHGCVSTDSEGGVRVEWIHPTSGVHLVIPPTEESEGYVYHEVGEAYGTEPASPESLARWLREIS
jgi:hypothetical protein